MYGMVGGLQYLTLTRPEISFAVGLGAGGSPRVPHLVAAKRIWRYLKAGLFWKPCHYCLPLPLKAEVRYYGDVTDRRSTTGFCLFFVDSQLSWKSKKEIVVARSSAEAEYRALADTTSEIILLRCLLKDMGLTLSGPTILFCDNKSAIQAHNDVFHE